MREQIEIDVQKRDGTGRDTRKSLSSMRAESRIPGVIYGGKKPSVKVALSCKDLLAARKRGGVNAILSLKLGGQVETVMVKTIQRHPVSELPIHADFQRISLTEKIEAKVPLAITGEAPGVKTDGGMLQHELRFVTVRALPTAIPQSLPVDVSGLQMNQRIQVKDLKAPEGVELLDSPDHVVVHVTLVKEEVIEPVPGEVAADAALSEPEVIAKGKKPLEGEEGAEAEGEAKPGAKPGAKPAAGAEAKPGAKPAAGAGAKPGAKPGGKPAK
ncbi:MAG: 50S ribosomal protein L25 [Elusimicrobia bacterium]|nr:50S ribosomal protein L25 [Elusimicrobiota bacterium]